MEDAHAAAVPAGHHTLGYLYIMEWGKQIRFAHEYPGSLVFAQRIVAAQNRLVQDGMHLIIGVIHLRHLVGVWDGCCECLSESLTRVSPQLEM